MKRYLVNSVVADIINDFNRIAFSHDLFPSIIGVSVDSTLCTPYHAAFRIKSIPRYEVLKCLNIRFNQVIVIVNNEADVVIEVYDDNLPF